MQVNNSNFINNDNYLEPFVNWLGNITYQVMVEMVKIVAAKVFLEYLSQRYLNHPSRIPSREVYGAVILAPLLEEIFFRLFVLQGIHLMQGALNQFDDDDSIAEGDEQSKARFCCIRLRSHFFADHDPQDQESETFAINLYPPVLVELLCQAFVRAIYLPQRNWNQYWGKDLTAREEKAQLQQIFRIHVSAVIFAAAHLSNVHSTKANAIIQCVWTYIGGVTYGYLSENYHSLAPSILAHGFNNSVALAGGIYPKYDLHLLLALLTNRLASYLLGTTSIGNLIVSGVARAHNFYFSLSERANQWYQGESAVVEEGI